MFFFFQAEDGIRDIGVTGVQTCALPISARKLSPAFCFAAKSLTSWVIFIEQNLGPHIEQKWAVLAPSAGGVWSWYCSAVSGSRLRLNWSRQRNSKRARDSASSCAFAAGWPFARSAAWAASL